MPLLNLLVSCAIWHHICSRSFKSWGRGSNLFVQHIPQMLNWIVICGIWRPGQHLELYNVSQAIPEQCVAECIILLEEATFTREHCCHEGLYQTHLIQLISLVETPGPVYTRTLEGENVKIFYRMCRRFGGLKTLHRRVPVKETTQKSAWQWRLRRRADLVLLCTPSHLKCIYYIEFHTLLRHHMHADFLPKTLV